MISSRLTITLLCSSLLFSCDKQGPSAPARRVEASSAALVAEELPADALRPGISARTPTAYTAASTANQSLFVWAEADPWSVHAARVTSTGTLLDPSGIALGFESRWLSVASSGSLYLVVGLSHELGVCGVRINSAGELLDAEPIVFGESTTPPTVAWNGSSFLVMWIQGGALMSRTLSAGGLLSASPVTTITGANKSQLTLASDGANFLAVWGENNAFIPDLYALRVNGAGAPLDAAPSLLVTQASTPAQVASDGSGYLVVWSNQPKLLEWARVGSDGVVSNRSASLTGSEPWHFVAAKDIGVSWNGSSYLITLSGDAGEDPFLARRVSGDESTVLGDGPSVVEVGLGLNEHGLVSSGSSHWVFGVDFPARLHPLTAVRLDASLAPSAPLIVQNAAVHQEMAQLTRLGAGALLTWFERPAHGVLDLRGRVFDANAQPLGGESFEIFSAGDARADAVSAGVDDWFVTTWAEPSVGQNGQTVYVARMTEEGTPLDGSELELTHGASSSPAVASDGQQALVVWGEGTSVLATRLDRTGAPLDVPALSLTPSAASGAVHPVQAVWNGERYVVFWSEDDHDLWARMVGPDGSLQPWQEFGEPDGVVSVAAEPDSVLLIRGVSFRAFASDWVGFTRLSGNLNKAKYTRAGAGWLGRSFLSVWLGNEIDPPLWGMFMRAEDTLHDREPFQLAPEGDEPTLVPLGPGRALVAYERNDEDEEVRARRIFTRVVSASALGEACSYDAECAEGVCVADLCAAGAPEQDAATSAHDAGEQGPGSPDASTMAGADSGAGAGSTRDAAVVERDAGAHATSDEDMEQARSSAGGCSVSQRRSVPPATCLLFVLALPWIRGRLRSRSRPTRALVTWACGAA